MSIETYYRCAIEANNLGVEFMCEGKYDQACKSFNCSLRYLRATLDIENDGSPIVDRVVSPSSMKDSISSNLRYQSVRSSSSNTESTTNSCHDRYLSFAPWSVTFTSDLIVCNNNNNNNNNSATQHQQRPIRLDVPPLLDQIRLRARMFDIEAIIILINTSFNYMMRMKLGESVAQRDSLAQSSLKVLRLALNLFNGISKSYANDRMTFDILYGIHQIEYLILESQISLLSVVQTNSPDNTNENKHDTGNDEIHKRLASLFQFFDRFKSLKASKNHVRITAASA